MNIAQVAFSIDWFLTIPGILISCGVILLIIALIMYIVSTNGNDKEVVPSVLENNKEDNEISVEPITEVEENLPLIDTVSEEVVVPSFEGDENAETIENPVDDSVTIEEFIPDVDEIPVIEVSEEEPVVEPVQEVEIPVIEEETVVEDVEHRPIYGGADPLEATQKLPKVDVHYEPYSGGNEVQEVTVIDDEETNEEPVFILNEEPTAIVDESLKDIEVEDEVPEIIAIPDDEIEEL